MAKIEENSKGFKVIEMTATEVWQIFGGYGICDYCNCNSDSGYYIAVLYSWYCPECYQEWIKRAKRYQNDMKIEMEDFELVRSKLGL